LRFAWATTGNYSFDIGGTLRGDDLHGLEFLGESKYYTKARDQGAHYRDYLAKCYRAFLLLPNRCDIFMWITWSPFQVTRWDEIRSPDYIRECVSEPTRAERVLGPSDSGPPKVDMDTCKQVADRLWLIFLSAEQERLVPTLGARESVEAYIVRSDPS
jgi:hypothetical protein